VPCARRDHRDPAGACVSITKQNNSTKNQVLHTVAYTLYGEGVQHHHLWGQSARTRHRRGLLAGCTTWRGLAHPAAAV